MPPSPISPHLTVKAPTPGVVLKPFSESISSVESPLSFSLKQWKRQVRQFMSLSRDEQLEEFQRLDIYLQDMVVSFLLRKASYIVEDHRDEELEDAAASSAENISSTSPLHDSTLSKNASPAVPKSSSPVKKFQPTYGDNTLPLTDQKKILVSTPDSISGDFEETQHDGQYYMQLIGDLLLTVEPSKALYLLVRYVSIRLVKKIFPQLREHMKPVIEFPKESVGRATSMDVVCVKENWTCQEALQYVHWLIDESQRRFHIMREIIQETEEFMPPKHLLDASDEREKSSAHVLWDSLSLPYKYLHSKLGFHHSLTTKKSSKTKTDAPPSSLYARKHGIGEEEVEEKLSDQRHVSVLYVVDDSSWRLLGVVSVMELMAFASHPHNANKPLSQLMHSDVPSIEAREDREKTIKILQYYHMNEIPVVDKRGTLLSVVTVRKCMQVFVEESTEDSLHAAGMGFISTKRLNQLGPLILLLKRSIWLIFLVLVSLISSNIVGAFQGVLSKYISLAFFMPLLTGCSGVVGNQSATIIIRSMVMGKMTLKTVLKYMARELFVLTGLSIVLGVMGFAIAMTRADWSVSLVVGGSLFMLAWISDLLGFFLPFAMKLVKLDPAIATGPILSTAMDACGLFIYFSFAILLLDMLHLGSPQTA